MRNKGQGFIGGAVILVLLMFFFSGFYVTLEMIYNNVLEDMIETASTQTYYDNYTRVLWLSFPIFFLFSVVIWGVVQTQSAYNTAAIAGIWIVILFGFTFYTAIFVSFDKLIMEDLLSFLPMAVEYTSVYEGLVKPLWRSAPFAVYGMFIFFGVYMASTYAEKGGSTYIGAYNGGRR